MKITNIRARLSSFAEFFYIVADIDKEDGSDIIIAGQIGELDINTHKLKVTTDKIPSMIPFLPELVIDFFLGNDILRDIIQARVECYRLHGINHLVVLDGILASHLYNKVEV